MDRQEFSEIDRRTKELRSLLDRSSTTPRRILYLATALHNLVGDKELPETWSVLNEAINRFNRRTAAEAIFDAEEENDTIVSTGKYQPPASWGRPNPSFLDIPRRSDALPPRYGGGEEGIGPSEEGGEA